MSNYTPTDLIETYLTGVTANLGYPVGMGMPANPDTVRKWAVDIAKLAGTDVPGMACVPVEPTEEMIIAGCEANPTLFVHGTERGFPADVAHDVYRAMIAAAIMAGEP